MQLQPKRTVEYTPDPNKFDLRTHAWNAQGHLVNTNHYRLFIIDGISYYERPVNSGNLWFENNQPAGRMKFTFGKNGAIASKELLPDAPHVEWTAPLEGDAALHYELEQLRAKNAAIERELAAVKAEREPEKSTVTAQAVVEGFPAQEHVEKAPAPKLTKRSP